MSLYNNVQQSLASQLGSPLSGNAGLIVDKFIPPAVENALSKATGIAGSLASGNLTGAGMQIARALGLKNETLQNLLYFNTPTPLFGGITPLEALTIYNRHKGIDWCRKNLWLLKVEKYKSDKDGNGVFEFFDKDGNIFGDESFFNMFAFNVDFSPVTISGEKKQVGAAHVDLVNSADPVEMTISTYDNTDGFMKSWFENQGAKCAAQDGTVGLPADYALKITVLHGFLKEGQGYKSVGLYRTANIALSLSRSEQALSELTMSFVQLDTFMAV